MLGYWNPRAESLIPKSSYSLQGVPYRAYTVMIDGKGYGAMRNVGNNGWMVSIPGFTFFTNGEGSAKIGIKETNVKVFKNVDLARAAINEAFEMLGIYRRK